MERANPRTWLSLKRCSRTVRVQPEQEGPVAATPLEHVAAAVAVRVPQVVLAWRYLGGQLSELPLNDLTRLRHSRQQVGEHLVGGYEWELGFVH